MRKEPYRSSSSTSSLRASSTKLTKSSGQSLIEILIGIGIAAIIIGGTAVTIGLTLRSNLLSKNAQIANGLADDLLNSLSVIAVGDWHDPYLVARDAAYHIATTSGGQLSITNAPALSESLEVDNITFTRSFTIQTVYRDAGGATSLQANPGFTEDPSTLQASVTVTWYEQNNTQTTPGSVTRGKLLTRSRSLIFQQTDWSGGGGQPGLWVIQTKYDTGSGIVTNNPVGSVRKSP